MYTGEDFDEALQRYLLEAATTALEQGATAPVPGDDPSAFPGCDSASLKAVAERVKVGFSERPTVDWQCVGGVGGGSGGELVQGTITVDEFHQLCGDLFDAVEEPVWSALEQAALSPDEVDEVVLVGGSSRLLRAREILQQVRHMDRNCDCSSSHARADFSEAQPASQHRSRPCSGFWRGQCD